MKRITFKADENKIAQARRIAKAEGKTLNEAFREWLKDYGKQSRVNDFDLTMANLKRIKAGRKFSRDQMNER